jgi:hypothetical protein
MRATITTTVLAVLAIATAGGPVRAADIRGDMKNGVVLEGKIEAGDYDKLRSVYGETITNQFYLGNFWANEIYLASPGGDLAEAMKIGRLERALKLHTIVPPRFEYPVSRQTSANKPQSQLYVCQCVLFYICCRHHEDGYVGNLPR